MNSSTAGWARGFFGDDAEVVGQAVWNALTDTSEAMLDVQAVARSKRRFASGGARMTNQYEQLVDRILDLGIEGTEVVKTGTWYRLPLVHNCVLYPVRAEVDGDEPGNQWPRNLSGVVQDLFAITDTKSQRWVAEPLVDADLPPVEVRPSLLDLAARDPRPRLVLVIYEMDLSGLKRVWWGQADLLDDAGTLGWVTERSLLTAPQRGGLFALPSSTEDDRFDSGDLPEVPMAGRPESDRNLNVPPTIEKADDTEGDTAESDED